MKKYLYITGCFLTLLANAQRPFVGSLDKTSGTANEIVNISGSGFTDKNKAVYFGNGKSNEVTFVDENLIQAKVPPTATYGPVTVINDNGMSSSSGQLFSISFDIDKKAVSTFTRDGIVSQAISDLQPYDLCMCDFDDDGLSDVAISTLGSDHIRIAQNTSTATTPNLKSNFSSIQSTPALTNKTANMACGDLNGDGFPDLVASSLVAGEPFVHVFENDGAGSFTFTKTRLTFPTFNGSNRQGKKIRIADIDGDRKPDLIVGSQTTNDNNVLIYKNTSSGSVSFFATPTIISISGATNTGGLDVGDFNNDGKTDLVVIPFRQVDAVYLLKNTSLPETISFNLEGKAGTNTERANVEIGDFDNDGFNDLAITRTSGLEIFKNNGSFSFTQLNLSSLLLSGVTAWGLDLGDINGDGLVDVIVSSIQGDQIIYYRNSTSGSINFTVDNQIRTEGPARNVRIGDLNADGKPDIAIADDSQAKFPGSFSYLINRSCMTPVITPVPSVYCKGEDFIVRATGGENMTYEWNVKGGTPINPQVTSNELNLKGYNINNTNISVSVTATSPDDLCSMASSPITYTIGTVPITKPVIDDPGLVCLTDDLVLTSSTAATNYTWAGPNGFSETTTADKGKVTISNVSAANSGTYSLVVDDDDCVSPKQTQIISISGPPVTSIEVTSCKDGSIELEVPDFSSQFNYQWKLGTTDIGTDSPTFTATTAGSYTLEITDANTCTYTSDAIVIPDVPVSSYANPDFGGGATSEVCTGVVATFTSNSTGDASLSLGYRWEVENPSGTITKSTGNSLNFTFDALGVWKVRLITEYTDGFGCDVVEKDITVSADPAFSITPSISKKCSNESITLTLTGANTASGDSWSWDDDDPTTELSGEISNVLSTMHPATYTATYTSVTGCITTTPPVTITNFDGIGVTATESIFKISGVNTTMVKRDTIIFTEDQTFVTLKAKNSLKYTWTAVTPSGTEVIKNIDDPSASSVLITPSAPVIIVTVSGQTLEGCEEHTDIVVIGNSLPRKSFSPNGDGLNDIWTINNSRNLEGCKVFIVDSRGATILNEKSPFLNDEVWDGTYKGKPTSEGVYYYILKCDDAENSQTGAILLSR